MAYTVGFLLADGAIEDVRKSSRSCYIQFSSKDLSLLEQIKFALNSDHNIVEVSPKLHVIRQKSFISGKQYYFRVGSKIMFQDLDKLGIAPKKALRIKLPRVPIYYFSYFLRGYFDGDGCINIYHPKNRSKSRVSLIFTSGCKGFLKNLSKKISYLLPVKYKQPYFNFGAYRLTYRDSQGARVLKFIYKNLTASPYLDRKYHIYQQSGLCKAA